MTTPAGSDIPRRALVVLCPDWPLVAAGVPPDCPAAVVHANRVVATNAAARAEGVGRGLRRREAQGRCPDLELLPPDPARDGRAFEAVAAAAATLTPRVEVVRPGTCAFPTRGPSRYHGGDDLLAARTAEAVAAVLGPGRCRVGVADGLFAAALTARAAEAATTPPVECAAESARPWAHSAAHSTLVVPPGETAAFLAPFPVGVLGRPELADLLWRLGIRTLGAFAALGTAHVTARFGTDGAAAHRLARGLEERPVSPRPPPPDLVVTAELDPPAERVDTVAFLARTLAAELHERLGALGLACTRLAIEAETEHGEHLSRLWRHERLDATAVAERVRWQLDGWLNGSPAARPTSGITLLRLVPDEVVPDEGRQLGFWGAATAAAERAARAAARLSGLLGPEAVTVPELRGGRSPAEQAVAVPWGLGGGGGSGMAAPGGPGGPCGPGGPDAHHVRDAHARAAHNARAAHVPHDAHARADALAHGAPWPGRVPAPAPAVVLPAPVPAEVVDVTGAPVGVTGRGFVTARPARISVDGGRWADVAAWAGPWPADERWWDPAAHRRRARFQLATATGEAHLVSLEAGRWWVEATYD